MGPSSFGVFGTPFLPGYKSAYGGGTPLGMVEYRDNALGSIPFGASAPVIAAESALPPVLLAERLIRTKKEKQKRHKHQLEKLAKAKAAGKIKKTARVESHLHKEHARLLARAIRKHKKGKKLTPAEQHALNLFMQHHHAKKIAAQRMMAQGQRVQALPTASLPLAVSPAVTGERGAAPSISPMPVAFAHVAEGESSSIPGTQMRSMAQARGVSVGERVQGADDADADDSSSDSALAGTSSMPSLTTILVMLGGAGLVFYLYKKGKAGKGSSSGASKSVKKHAPSGPVKKPAEAA